MTRAGNRSLSFRTKSGYAGVLAGAVVCTSLSVAAQINRTPEELKSVQIREHLGALLPLDIALRDSDGRVRRLRDFFPGNRPVLVNLFYHSCPMLCSLVLNATLKTLKELDWTVGKDFDVISISIDPRDTPAMLKKKRQAVLAQYGRPAAASGWHFLSGQEPSLRKITRVLGFEYTYDAEIKQYAHPAAVVLTTPRGKVARYLYGISFDTQDFRLGLLEASRGRSMSVVDKVMLYCYRYDPQRRSYVLMATRIMRFGGSFAALLLFSFLAFLWRREFRARKSSAVPLSGNDSTTFGAKLISQNPPRFEGGGTTL